MAHLSLGLAVEAEADARLPLVGGARVGISGSPQALACGAGQCDGEAGPDEATHFRVRPVPFGSEARCEPLARSLGLAATHTIHREHEGGEVPASGQAEIQVLVPFLLLVTLEDLGGVLPSVGRRIRVRHSDVKDGCGV